MVKQKIGLVHTKKFDDCYLRGVIVNDGVVVQRRSHLGKSWQHVDRGTDDWKRFFGSHPETKKVKTSNRLGMDTANNIRKLWRAGTTQKRLSEIFNVSLTTIYGIVKNKVYSV